MNQEEIVLRCQQVFSRQGQKIEPERVLKVHWQLTGAFRYSSYSCQFRTFGTVAERRLLFPKGALYSIQPVAGAYAVYHQFLYC